MNFLLLATLLAVQAAVQTPPPTVCPTSATATEVAPALKPSKPTPARPQAPKAGTKRPISERRAHVWLV